MRDRQPVQRRTQGIMGKGLTYVGLMVFFAYEYGTMPPNDQAWLQALAMEAVRGSLIVLSGMMEMAAPLLIQVWQAAAPYAGYILLLALVVAAGFGIVVYVVNLRDQTRKQIDANVDELEGLI